MTKEVKLDSLKTKPLEAREMLRSVAEENPKEAFLIVWPEDGPTEVYNHTERDAASLVHTLNTFIHQIYNGDYDE